MKSLSATLLGAFAAVLISSTGTSAFAPPAAFSKTYVATNSAPYVGSFAEQHTSYILDSQPAALQKQRSSVAKVTTMGLFGLGGPEIAIILVAAAFLLGPQKLAELGKDAGKMAGELKEVPKEFQKGLEEGEAEAQAMKKKISAGADAPVKDVESE
eukprot:CAMPEP_0195510464 /NCGR_PEP_ID=MMETSP0794_2-20130614/3102_1 /TAXON_ID=515487 /ORGANISM="Stephanopyxis turris, Strain CCMP 815" /LENGTH=155 /DNA_ID=CAMNT_0040637891 /DNA_START=120 /DNA_END=587 /DNA_ORIENTATION=+